MEFAWFFGKHKLQGGSQKLLWTATISIAIFLNHPVLYCSKQKVDRTGLMSVAAIQRGSLFPFLFALDQEMYCWSGAPQQLSFTCNLPYRSDYPSCATHTLSRRWPRWA